MYFHLYAFIIRMHFCLLFKQTHITYHSHYLSIYFADIFIINQRDIFQHVPIIFQKPVKPDSMGVPGFSPFGDVHMSFRIPPRLDARE